MLRCSTPRSRFRFSPNATASTPPRNEKMSGRKRKGKTSGLPDELLADILARLPALTVLKFRKVSKSWKALIDSKHFIDLHMSRHHHARSSSSSSASPNIVILEVPGGGLYPRYFAANLDSDPSLDKVLADVLELHCPFPYDPIIDFSRYNFHGCCNGLLCLTDYKARAFLWNPCTHKYWILPDPTIPAPVTRECCSGRSIKFGFGYDDCNDDYKVVRFVKTESTGTLQVEICSLKANSWKILPLLPYKDGCVISGRAASLVDNCLLHWVMYDTGDVKYVIVALDLRTEKYHIVPFPRIPEDNSRLRVAGLGVWPDGCLYLSVRGGFPFSTYADVWVMKDYGMKDSWTKMISVPVYNHDYPMPLAYSSQRSSSSSQVVIFYTSRQLLCFESNTGRLVRAAAFCYPVYLVVEAYHFVASLVQLPGSCSGSGYSCSKWFYPLQDPVV